MFAAVLIIAHSTCIFNCNCEKWSKKSKMSARDLRNSRRVAVFVVIFVQKGYDPLRRFFAQVSQKSKANTLMLALQFER